MVTSNHVHVLTKDTGANVIARSMRLIAAPTGQEDNERKGWDGAFWEDRYRATAIETDEERRAPYAILSFDRFRSKPCPYSLEEDYKICWTSCDPFSMQPKPTTY